MVSTEEIIGTFLFFVANLGWFLGRWTIRQYDTAPQYSYNDNESPPKPSSSTVNEATNNQSESAMSPLETHLPEYRGPNPFTIRKLSYYERCKIYFFCISGIALLRLMMMIAWLIYAYLVVVVITSIIPSSEFRASFLRKLMRLFAASLLFINGFYFIEQTDSRPDHQRDGVDDTKHPIRVIVANHNTLYDGFVALWMTSSVMSGKKELSQMPMMGLLNDACGTLWIDRSGKKGRDFAKNQIINHVKDYTKPPLFVFPQGTTSNIHTVTVFKTGAFAGKERVMEMSLNWSRNTNCDLSHASKVHGMARLIHIGCCQFINYCHVDICDAHIPSDEERADLTLFAENSRKTIVDSLNRISKLNNPNSTKIIATEHSYSDWVLLCKASKDNESFDTSNILMGDIISRLNLRTRTVTKLAEEFARFDVDNSGYIEYAEFCEAFNRDPNEESQQMRDLFNVFNARSTAGRSDKIGFDQFLVGIATSFIEDMHQDAIKIMFNANLEESDGSDDAKYILKKNIVETYQRGVDKAYLMMQNGEDDNGNGFEEWMQSVERMKKFVEQVFGEKERMTLEEFDESVEKHGQQQMVRLYLQGIILVRLGIKLCKEDFVVEDKGIYVNPLAKWAHITPTDNPQ